MSRAFKGLGGGDQGVTISGSWGDFIVDPTTGAVISDIDGNRANSTPYGDEDKKVTIHKVHLAEYRRWEKKHGFHTRDTHVDILNVGYWYSLSGHERKKFEKPVAEHRRVTAGGSPHIRK